jgi:hypothetical protein
MSETHTNASVLSLDELINGGGKYDRVELPIEKSPGVKGCIYLRPLTAGAVVAFITEGEMKVDGDGKVISADPAKQQDAMLRFIARAVCDEKGNLIFPDANNLDLLRRLPMTVYNALQAKLVDAIVEGNEAGKALEAVVAAASSETPSSSTDTATPDGSSTDSPLQ